MLDSRETGSSRKPCHFTSSEVNLGWGRVETVRRSKSVRFVPREGYKGVGGGTNLSFYDDFRNEKDWWEI